jgi:GTPase KRas protein
LCARGAREKVSLLLLFSFFFSFFLCFWAENEMSGAQMQVKLCVMGDGGTGKTASTIQFVANHFVEMYDPTIEDSYKASFCFVPCVKRLTFCSKRHIQVDDQQFMVDILDTAGQDDFSPLRDSWIRESQGFLLIFSLTERKSLDYLDSILGQIRRTKEDDNLTVPIVLAGNKCDLADRRQVSQAEAAEWARVRGIKTVVEMSAKTRHNITETFQKLVKEVAAGREQPKKIKDRKMDKCTVL